MRYAFISDNDNGRVLTGQSACSLKEAAIVASVLSKVSVPMLHSAAALARLAQMDYSGESFELRLPTYSHVFG